jgi:hypothetical protein
MFAAVAVIGFAQAFGGVLASLPPEKRAAFAESLSTRPLRTDGLGKFRYSRYYDGGAKQFSREKPCQQQQ